MDEGRHVDSRAYQTLMISSQVLRVGAFLAHRIFLLVYIKVKRTIKLQTWNT